MAENTEAPAGTGTVSQKEEHPFGTERIPIVDAEGYDTGGTLYMGAAVEQYQEDVRWDGHNWISTATGSQWDHQQVNRTRRGKYYLVSWSQWQGSKTEAVAMSLDDAAQWVLRAGYLPSDCGDPELAAKVKELLDQ